MKNLNKRMYLNFVMRRMQQIILPNIFLIIGLIHLLKMLFTNYVSITLDLIILVFICLLCIADMGRIRTQNRFAVIFGIYCLWQFSTVINTVAYHYNMSGYLTGIAQTAIPMLMFYVGMRIDVVEENICSWWKSGIIIILVSLFLHILNPGFYYNYCSRLFSAYNGGADMAGYYSRYPRMIGILQSPQTMGMFSLICMCLTIRLKDLCKKKSTFYLALTICISGVILSMQRACWMGMALSLCVYAVSMLRSRKLLAALFGMMGMGMFTVIVLWNRVIAFLAGSNWGERILSIPGVLIERFFNGRNQEALQDFLLHPFMGSGFYHAGSLDGNWIRILSDVGIIGIMLLLLLLLKALRNMCSRKNYMLFILMLSCMIAALGSPTFDGMVTGGFGFWMVTGYAVGLGKSGGEYGVQ